MNLHDMLPPGALDAVAGQLGVPREQAERGVSALLPSILAGMGDKAGVARPEAPDELDAQVNALGGGNLADNVLGADPTDVAKGNQLLGGIFGSKDVSREVAGRRRKAAVSIRRC